MWRSTIVGPWSLPLRRADPETIKRVVDLWVDHLDPFDGYPTLTSEALAERTGLSRSHVLHILREHCPEWNRLVSKGYMASGPGGIYRIMAWSKKDRAPLQRKRRDDIPKGKLY